MDDREGLRRVRRQASTGVVVTPVPVPVSVGRAAARHYDPVSGQRLRPTAPSALPTGKRPRLGELESLCHASRVDERDGDLWCRVCGQPCEAQAR
jgi:hypothetical protein